MIEYSLKWIDELVEVLSNNASLINGQDMGLVSKDSAEGDDICVLHGSRVPVVLQRGGSGYEVIGQCYWHDWMYGDKVGWKEGEGDTFLLI